MSLAVDLDGRFVTFAAEYGGWEVGEGLSLFVILAAGLGQLLWRQCIDMRREVEARLAAECELSRQMLHDPLTGLPNRRLLSDRLTNTILAAQRDAESCALLLIDLDHFKEVNDTLGHHAGDLLLQQVAQRLSERLRKADTLARLGGDEFALVLRKADAARAGRVAEIILGLLATPFERSGGTTHVSASIGVAISPEHANTEDALMRCADVAMYRAKQRHGSYETYAVEFDLHSTERLSLAGELRKALQQRSFTLHYQPKARLPDLTVVGVEALARWPHPVRGWIPPDEFIPQLEKHGLIRPFTQWVLETAALFASQCRSTGRLTPVAVNVSPATLRDPGFFEDVLRLVDRMGGTGDWLELEVTENALLENPGLLRSRMGSLRARGVRLSIDDFGTGYSSLTYLREFGADTLKIDRSFMVNLSSDARNGVIVEAVVRLAHALDIEVIAEGLEDKATCDRLVMLGCDQAQGYYIGKPMPSDELEIWLRTSVGDRLDRAAVASTATGAG